MAATGRLRATGIVVPDLLWIAVVAVAYVVFAEVGFQFAFATRQVTAVWPPTGIAVAALVLLGYRVWPGIFIGAFVSNAISQEPLYTAAGIAVGNTLGPVLGAYLLRRVEFDERLERVRDVLALVLVGPIAMTVTATNGIANLALAHIVPLSAAGPTWLLWWVGDSMGVMLFAPVIMTWASTAPRALDARTAIEIAILGAGLTLTSTLLFLKPYPFGFPVYPFVLWTALRFRQRATSLAIVAICSLAVWGTVHDLGPFNSGTLDYRLGLLVTFMAVLAVTGLLPGALIAERQNADTQLRAAERRFHALAEVVPQMVWMADDTGWIDWQNHRWFEYTGQQRDESTGWGWQRALHPEDYPRIMRDWPRSIATGEPFAMEARIRRQDGAYRWFLLRAEPQRVDRRGARWYGTNTDIDDQKRALQQSTRIAETLQAAFIPGRLPMRANIGFDALYLAAESSALIGGDWYDACELPDGRIAVSIGDVAGHGVSAAVTATRIRQSIIALAFDGSEPHEILACVNRMVVSQEETLATALVAIVDADASAMRYASAGHPPPVVGAPDTPPYLLAYGGAPLGAADEIQTRTTDVPLPPDVVVLFYTDGVTEFKRDVTAAEAALRLAVAQLVRDNPVVHPAMVVQRSIMGPERANDDVVLMVMQRSPSRATRGAPMAAPVRKAWTFHSSDAYFARAARHELMGFIRRFAADPEELSQAELIVGEILANTVEHAPGIVSVGVDWQGVRPVLTIVDCGPGLEHYAAQLPENTLSEDGRGLFLIGTLAHSVRVDAAPGQGTTMTVVLPLVRDIASDGVVSSRVAPSIQ